MPTRDIADHLGLSRKTIDADYEHIKAKLGVRNARELIRLVGDADRAPYGTTVVPRPGGRPSTRGAALRTSKQRERESEDALRRLLETATLAEWMQSKYGLAIQVSADPAADPDRNDVRVLLFESVRELLFKVVKHAAGAAATVDLSLTGQTLRVTVADTGPGSTRRSRSTRRAYHTAAWGFSASASAWRCSAAGSRWTTCPGGGSRVRLVAPWGKTAAHRSRA